MEEMKLEIQLIKNKINHMEAWIKQANNVIHCLQEQIFDFQDQQLNLKYLEELTCKISEPSIK